MDSYANTQFFNDFFNVIFSWRRCRKAVRATGILIPLLGLQFLVFIKRPNDKDSTLYDVYTYAVAIVVSLQVSICKLGINFRSRSTACANLGILEVGLGWGVKGGGRVQTPSHFSLFNIIELPKKCLRPFFFKNIYGVKV